MRLVFLSIALAANLWAHADLSTTIKALSEQIEKKPTADLYFQRATEYLALRERDHAIEDLRMALKLEPAHRSSRLALIKVLGASGESLQQARTLLAASKPPQEKVEAATLLAHIHQRRGDLASASSVCRKTDQEAADLDRDPEFDLRYADILLELGQPRKAAPILKAAWQRTGSIVLRNNWIDAAISANEIGEVLPIIEKELRSSRLRSTWYLKRARALLIRHRTEAAKKDLNSALEEINNRINSARPDLTLIADRGLTLWLLGQSEAAKQDLEMLKKSGLPESAYRLLSSTIREQDRPND